MYPVVMVSRDVTHNNLHIITDSSPNNNNLVLTYTKYRNLRNRCMYSETSQEKNNCTDAHSIEELEEWKERHEYRMMKMKKAKDQKLYSFMDELLTKYNFSTSEMSVVSYSELEILTIVCLPSTRE